MDNFYKLILGFAGDWLGIGRSRSRPAEQGTKGAFRPGQILRAISTAP